MARNDRKKNGGGKDGRKPNILVIWGDDIGQSNLSCYTHGLMGYRTPNIDRIAKEGMLFTDSYGEQSCTAGRSRSEERRVGKECRAQWGTGRSREQAMSTSRHQ